MKLNKSIVALTSLVAFAATPLFAGTGKTFKETVVVEEEASSWYNAALSTGYDSLYMFRGVNTLGGPGTGYGNSLWWTDANFTWNISENDTLTVGGWQIHQQVLHTLFKDPLHCASSKVGRIRSAVLGGALCVYVWERAND